MSLPLLKWVHFFIASILQILGWSQKAVQWSGYQDIRIILQPKAENMFFSYSFHTFVFQAWVFTRLTQKTTWRFIFSCYHYIIDTHFYSYFHRRQKGKMVIFISSKELPTWKSKSDIKIDNSIKKNLIHHIFNFFQFPDIPGLLEANKIKCKIGCYSNIDIIYWAQENSRNLPKDRHFYFLNKIDVEKIFRYLEFSVSVI